MNNARSRPAEPNEQTPRQSAESARSNAESARSNAESAQPNVPPDESTEPSNQEPPRNEESSSNQETPRNQGPPIPVPTVFVPLSHARRASRNPSNIPALRRFQRQRKAFVCKVYSLTIIFVTITSVQWFMAITTPAFKELFETSHVITLFSMLGTFFLLMTFICVDQIRYNQPCNYFFSLLIVECATFGLMRSLLHSTVTQFIVSVVITTIAFLTFIYIGAMLPRDLTMDVLVLSIVSFVFYFITTLLIVMVLLTDAYFPDLVFVCLLVILLVVYVMYNAQIISGTRIGALRWNEYLLGALLLYFNYIVMLAMCLFTTGLLWWYNKVEKEEQMQMMEELRSKDIKRS